MPAWARVQVDVDDRLLRWAGDYSVGQVWQKARRFLYRRILHTGDSPHRIALGVALATLVAFTPTMGLQTVIAVGLAALFRANKAVCIPVVWITNPVTFAPIYGACWWLGSVMLPGTAAPSFQAIQAQLAAASAEGVGFWTSMFSYDFWANMAALMLKFGWELWLGCLVVGVFFGLVFYFATLWIVTGHRARRHDRKMRRHARRAGAHARKKLITAGDPS